jgi:glycosyltransferase involved in cell wall biosynthesis
MSSKPIFSVLLPTYNHGCFLRESIESVLRQTESSFELIVVDNGSTDHTPDVLDAILDNRIVRLKVQDNAGPSPALNMAYEHSRGRYLCFFTGDDLMMPQKLAQQRAYLDSHTHVDVLGTWIELADSSGTKISGHSMESWMNQNPDFNQTSTWIWNNPMAAPTLVFRRSVFEKIGGFAPSLMYIQDWDFLIRCHASGLNIECLPQTLLRYRVHTSNLSSQSSGRLTTEYLKTCTETLIPLLLKNEQRDLIIDLFIGFTSHQEFLSASRDARNIIVETLLRSLLTQKETLLVANRNHSLLLQTKKIVSKILKNFKI